MYYVLYSIPVIAWVAILVLVGVLTHRLRAFQTLQQDFQKQQQSNTRLTLHLDHLMRHFHIHGNDVPYVAQNETRTAPILCWHCQAPQGHPHTSKCPYGYVRDHFKFTANGQPILRS